MTKYLYLPIESWVREFHSKLLLTLFAVEKNWIVIIGPKTSLLNRITKFPKGTVLEFGLHKNNSVRFKKFNSLGHKIVSIDEEGIATLESKVYNKLRVSLKSIKYVDKFFCWGNTQFNYLKKSFSGKLDKIIVTGNPRIDLLRRELRGALSHESNLFKKKFGNFILVNTNFGLYNHIMGNDYRTKTHKDKGWLSNKDDINFQEKRVNHKKKIFYAFQELIVELSKKGYKVVVRPHPSESSSTWINFKNKLENNNVYVEKEGNVASLINASKLVIHNGCTTAIESFVLEKPVIAYRPFLNDQVEAKLPNEISIIAKNKSDIFSILSNIHSYKDDRKTKESLLKKSLSSLQGELASQKIINNLPEVQNIEKFDKNFPSKLSNFIFSLKRKISSIRKDKIYLKIKCNDLKYDEVVNVLKLYEKELDLNLKLKIKDIGAGMMMIHS